MKTGSAGSFPAVAARRVFGLAVACWIAQGQAQTPTTPQPADAASAQIQSARPEDCPSLQGQGVRRLSQGDLHLSWRPLPDPIPLNRPFELEIVLCAADAELIKVDADMPAHRHGMNYRPTLHALAARRVRAQGLLFHMSGAWRLMFDVQRGPQALRLTDTVQLP